MPISIISLRKGSVPVKAKPRECVGCSPSLANLPTGLELVRLNCGCDDELSIGDYNIRTAIAACGSDMIFGVD
jgi:hypothetical protein